jgi:hypothetical protein
MAAGGAGRLSGGEGNADLPGGRGVSPCRRRAKGLHQLAQHLQQSEMDRARLDRQKMMEGRTRRGGGGGATHGSGSEPPPRGGKHDGGSEGAKHGDGEEEARRGRAQGLAGRVVYLV